MRAPRSLELFPRLVAFIYRRSRSLCAAPGRRRARAVRAAEVSARPVDGRAEPVWLRPPPAGRVGRGSGWGRSGTPRSVIGSWVQCSALGRGLELLQGRSRPPSLPAQRTGGARLQRPLSLSLV